MVTMVVTPKTAVKFAWPFALMVTLDQDAYGIPGLRRIPLWLRIVALASAIARAINFNRRRAKLRRSLVGQRVLITGGASGIGLLLAHRCVRAGALVVIWDVQPAACARALDELRRAARDKADVVAQTVDVTDRVAVYESIDTLRREVGEMDVVVLNAGVVGGKSVIASDDAVIARTMDVNATSHSWLVKATLPAMLARNHGQIVSIASAAAMGGMPGLAEYAASKAAAFTYAEAVRLEVRKAGRRGVHVTTICPFFIATVRAPLARARARARCGAGCARMGSWSRGRGRGRYHSRELTVRACARLCARARAPARGAQGMFEGVTSRWDWLLPILSPERVAERIMEAILCRDHVVVLPPLLHVLPVLRGLLPVPFFDAFVDLLGGLDAMDGFVGRGGLVQLGLHAHG
jgi:all-trans-retinol dehydrogenase (NAD+)